MKYFVITIFLLNNIIGFAQSKTTPAVITREAKNSVSIALKDNGADGYYAEQTNLSGIITFEYNYTAAQQEGIADDELKEIIAFQIKPDKSGKFTLTNDDLKKANAYFYRGCFCADRGTHLITSGNIRGARMTRNTWYINMQVTADVKQGENLQKVTKKLKGYFTLVNP
jgi:hypothetical protein